MSSFFDYFQIAAAVLFLVTTGIFAISRNPIFIFLDLYFIGTFLINGTLSFLIAAVLAVVGNHNQIVREEKFLASRYGKPYQDYRVRTPRYFSLRRILPKKA